MLKKILSIFLFVSCLQAFKIDRVILSSNEKRMYLDFWPLVAKAWRDIIGVKPTLFLISDEYLEVDETLGDVIRLKPISGVTTASYSQIIRLFAPAYFPDDICIISDIDMLPLSKEYFVDSVKDVPDDCFVVYRNYGYGKKSLRFPMCYSAGKGYLFKEIFKLKNLKDIPEIIKSWACRKHGWDTDEIMLHTYVRGWERKSNLVFLNHDSMGSRRIHRQSRYKVRDIKNGYYIDYHMPKPLSQYRSEIKRVSDELGI